MNSFGLRAILLPTRDPRGPMHNTSKILFLIRVFFGLLLMVLLWATLAGSYPYASWYIGLPIVLLAVLALRPSASGPLYVPWRAHQLFVFILFFIFHSVKGATDVARRVIAPRLAIDPQQLGYHVGLPAGPSRILFIGAINLLPGTLVIDARGKELIIHALDASASTTVELQRLERRIAALFGIDMSSVET